MDFTKDELMLIKGLLNVEKEELFGLLAQGISFKDKKDIKEQLILIERILVKIDGK